MMLLQSITPRLADAEQVLPAGREINPNGSLPPSAQARFDLFDGRVIGPGVAQEARESCPTLHPDIRADRRPRILGHAMHGDVFAIHEVDQNAHRNSLAEAA